MATIKKVRITKNDASGAILPNPVVYEVCAEGFTLEQQTKTESINCLTSKAAVKKVTGKDFSGDWTLFYTLQNAGLIVPLVMGAPTATTDATATAWAADTVYALGDITNHSDGKHSLVATYVKGDGKSGGAEPAAGAGNGSTSVQDNNVRWAVVPKLIKSVGEFSDTPVLVSVEYELDDGTGTPFFKRFNGVEASKLPVAVTGEGGIPKAQTDLSPMSAEDSEQAAWDKDLATIAGAKIVKMGKDYYSGDSEDQNVYLDAVKGCVYDANIDIDKAIKQEACSGGVKKNKRETTMSGKSKADFTRDQYNAYRVQSASDYKFEYKSGMGGYLTVEFPKVVPLPSDAKLEAQDSVMLEPELSAEEDTNGVLAKYEVVYPQFIAEDGTVIGAF